MAELRGTGNSPRRWLLDRTTLTVQTPTERTLVPLDQVVTIHVGGHPKGNGHMLPLALGLVLAVAGAALWFTVDNMALVGMGLIGIGVLMLVGGAVLMFIGGSKGLMVHTSAGEHAIRHPLDADLDDFVDELVASRNAYLEGIDTVE